MNTAEIKILIADDDPDILNFLKYNLEKEDYWVYAALNGADALKMALKIVPHVIVLDVMMPGMNGVDTCKAMREFEALRNIPIAMLTAVNQPETEAACLAAGANDFITKPIRPKLLLSRIQSLLPNDLLEGSTTNFKVGNLEVDTERYEVITNKRKVDLPKKEFELLQLLISKPGKTYRRDEIRENIWRTETLADDRTIDVHVYNLREKIGDEYIKTVKGVGYKLDY